MPSSDISSQSWISIQQDFSVLLYTVLSNRGSENYRKLHLWLLEQKMTRLETKDGLGRRKEECCLLTYREKALCLGKIATATLGFLNNGLRPVLKSSQFLWVSRLERFLNPLRGHWKLIQPGTGCVEDGVGNGCSDRDDRWFAATLWRQRIVFDQNGFNLRHP